MDMKGYRGSIPAERVEVFAAAITPLDTDEVRAAYRAGDFPRADAVRDLDKRYRWDLMSAAGCTPLAWGLYDEGFNDTHVDTALRFIVAPLH